MYNPPKGQTRRLKAKRQPNRINELEHERKGKRGESETEKRADRKLPVWPVTQSEFPVTFGYKTTERRNKPDQFFNCNRSFCRNETPQKEEITKANPKTEAGTSSFPLPVRTDLPPHSAGNLAGDLWFYYHSAMQGSTCEMRRESFCVFLALLL